MLFIPTVSASLVFNSQPIEKNEIKKRDLVEHKCLAVLPSSGPPAEVWESEARAQLAAPSLACMLAFTHPTAGIYSFHQL